ncbi:MAG: hypothetical protein OXU69_13525 [Gemmatimonadota bacterium]|nr:hypothetical protein [Gemmatimonadota bacterium]MDE2985719.1 hypothetical protein [Gemmatimonadota bacterium]
MSACDHFETPATVQSADLRFHRDAYNFLLDALHGVISRLSERRHISGEELADAVRTLAMERFGPMARTVLEYWGIRSTGDLGEMVFDLVELGILVKDHSDRPEDFANVFDFEEVFDHDYPWTVYPWKVATLCPWTVATTVE